MSSETSYSGLGAALSGIVVIQATQTATPTVYAGAVVITQLSGGTQLPNIPCSKSVGFSAYNILSGNNQGGQVQTYAGGLGNNAPYNDGSANPTFNGAADGVPQGITNLNQIRVVAAGAGSSGAYLVYTTVD